MIASDLRSGSDWRSLSLILTPIPNPMPNPSWSEPNNFSFNSLHSFRLPIWTYNYPFLNLKNRKYIFLNTEPGWWCGAERWQVQSETWSVMLRWDRLSTDHCCEGWYGNTTRNSPPSDPRPDSHSSDCERTASMCWTAETGIHTQKR